jgi:nucleotidyltransferase substrate binding protein (TIGR01987 family)
MTKINSQIEDLKKAKSRLSEAISQQKTDITRDATIQRFEYTFELSWKIISGILKEKGTSFYGMKSLFRDAGRMGIIDNVEEWFEYLEARNLTTHTYDEVIAEQVYSTAQKFSNNLDTIIAQLEKAMTE